MTAKIIPLLAISTAFIFSSCSKYDQGVNNPIQSKIVKTEKKWLVNNNDNKRLTLISFKEYDQHGQLITSNEYSVTGVLSKSISVTYLNNLSIEKTAFYNVSGTLDSSMQSTSVLDVNGQILQKTSIDNHGDTVAYSKFEYDAHGNILTNISFSQGKIQNIINYNYNYNSDGELVERTQSYANSIGFIQKDILSYSDNNLRIDKQEINSNGTVDLIYTYIYNYFGLVAKEIQKTQDGVVTSTYEYEYSYY